MEKLLNELSCDGHSTFSLPENDMPDAMTSSIPSHLTRQHPPALPQVSEMELLRHFTRLSYKNHSLAKNLYPLGSCTMKYNPVVNEKICRMAGLSRLHPYQPENTIQGALEILYELEHSLCEIAGMDAFTLQPAAGAHGEFAGMLIARNYFKSKNQQRTKIIVPDSAHGTNPSSATLAGFSVVPLPSEKDGSIDIEKLKIALTPDVACIMLTVPNTLGVFEKQILTIAQIAHDNGTLLYYDGANLNALIGTARPGDFGFDIIHINLHKTFSTPHGGGGPGSGPVGVKAFLAPFLPVPSITKKGKSFALAFKGRRTIGRLRSFYGNFPVLVRAYAYIVALGGKGLTRVSHHAVLNANYLLSVLKDVLPAPAGTRCMHEFVLSGKPLAQYGVRTLDVAKRLLDKGYYAPTIYFPLIVEEAIMIEPTETETKKTMDEFVAVFRAILAEAATDPSTLTTSPHTTPVSRLNEVEAARKPILHF
ncbi:MAG: aminomethyl-transferring glycine dehydrogenase subunit GcvPB [Elusimicrobia bacterium]|nr:aminomethyl-transferring glycine dehydrogenase subunit GcvPB [Elusimicrobiota bacterium]